MRFLTFSETCPGCLVQSEDFGERSFSAIDCTVTIRRREIYFSLNFPLYPEKGQRRNLARDWCVCRAIALA